MKYSEAQFHLKGEEAEAFKEKANRSSIHQKGNDF